MSLFTIDGKEFNIPVVSLKREAPVLDKYATRTEDGGLQREIIGVYYNYNLTFPKLNLNREKYAELWDAIKAPVEFHTFTVPGSDGDYTFKGYITTTGDNLVKAKNGKYYWGGLSIKFIAKDPARTPAGGA